MTRQQRDMCPQYENTKSQQPEPVHKRNGEQCQPLLLLRFGRQHDLPPRGRDQRLDAGVERREPHGGDL